MPVNSIAKKTALIFGLYGIMQNTGKLNSHILVLFSGSNTECYVTEGHYGQYPTATLLLPPQALNINLVIMVTTEGISDQGNWTGHAALL